MMTNKDQRSIRVADLDADGQQEVYQLEKGQLSIKSPLEGGKGGVQALQQKEFPQYTRPEDFMGWKVPKVLLSGDHKKIEEWRNKQSKKFL